MERLGALDAEFLHIEDGVTHMHIGSCAVFEGPTPAYEEVVAMLEAALPEVPRYRQRVRSVPLNLGRPLWVDDPHFNIAYHVRHTALPAPGGDEQLRLLVGRLMSQELDRSRPLWENWFVEGLEGDRWALVAKVHHCMVDGVAGTDLMDLVLDDEPRPVTPSQDDWRPEPDPGSLRLLADAGMGALDAAVEAGRSLPGLVRSPMSLVQGARDVVSGIGSFGSGARPTPASSLQGPIGPHRRWSWATARLDDARAVRSALGGTVNDVLLAAIAGGFHELLVSRGEDPSATELHTLVPVSVRAQRGVLDNEVSAMVAELPVAIADPRERYAAVRRETDRLKESHEAEAGQVLTTIGSFAPPVALAFTTRAAVRLMRRFPQRSVNTVTTNVPGPQHPLYATGRRMLEYLPYVPIAPGAPIGVAILSYDGALFFGVTGDYETAPDLHVLCEAIEKGMVDLVAVA